MNTFLDLIKKRRSIYGLDKKVALSKDEITHLIQDAVKNSPSAFNSQSSRVVVLFDASHKMLWDLTEDALKAIVPADKFQPTADKINSFRSAFGTVLFFEDQKVISELQTQFATYAKNFPIWSEHSTAIAQFTVWTNLANHNIGASLQHYNELIEKTIKNKLSLPESWKISAQMPFGGIISPAGEKTFIDDQLRFKRFD